MTLISLSDIVKSYQRGDEKTMILNHISLTISHGELLAIKGASGSGKSTLMNIIGLLDKADTGEYRLQKQRISDLNEEALANIRNQHIGFVFQQFHLLPRLNALQNVSLPLTYRHQSNDRLYENALQALRRVGMDKFAAQYPHELSGGQQQRIAIARALVGEPQIIVADEPTGALDSVTGNTIMDLFLSLHQDGKTILIVTHDESLASRCQREIILKDGQIISKGLPSQ